MEHLGDSSILSARLPALVSSAGSAFTKSLTRTVLEKKKACHL